MSVNKNKISVVAPSQLPAFVQDDYPTFVAFLQAYYEYLEQEGKLSWTNEKLESAFDIDETLDDFIDFFKNQYLHQFPAEILADKALLIKNIKQFYLAKGSEKSLKFLFRALFGEDISIIYPNRSILRVSDGKWIREQALRVTGDILNIYEGDGNTSSFVVTDDVPEANLFVTINDAEISTSSYTFNDRILTFSSNIADGDIVQVSIDGGDYQKFVGYQIFGDISGASAVVEAYKVVYDKGEFYNELTITDVTKPFVVGENAYVNYVDDENNVTVKLAVPITSSVIAVDVVDGGAYYNVGDPLIFTSNTGFGAQAYVATIFKAGIRSLDVLARGAGFKSGTFFELSGGGGSGAVVYLDGVDASGNTHPNTYNVNSDILRNFQNTYINANSYGFAANTLANVNTALANAFSYTSYGPCGPIDPQQVLILAEGENYETTPNISLASPVQLLSSGGNTANVKMSDFGILGALQIQSAGSGYAVGDELVFTVSAGATGVDAAAAVTEVSGSGGISKVEFQYPRIGGTVRVTSGSNTVLGFGTDFVKDVTNNNNIIVFNQIRRVISVVNANCAIVDSAWTSTANNVKLGVSGRNFVGGSGYRLESLPNVTVTSTGGSNASIRATAIIGDGEDVRVSSLQPVGRIRTVTVSQGGENYITAPDVDLSGYGDGTAEATARIAGGMFEYPGVYRSEDGHVSGSAKIQNRDFYQLYSYVIKSRKTLDAYEQILKELAHPAGMKYFAEVISDVRSVDITPVMSHHEFEIERPVLELLLSGSAAVRKTMNYIVISRVDVSGNAGVSKQKNVTMTFTTPIEVTTWTTDPVFTAALTSSMEWTGSRGNGSFTRALTGTTSGYEGQLYTVAPGEMKFVGARRVQNLFDISSEDANNVSLTKSSLTPAYANANTLDGCPATRLVFTGGSIVHYLHRPNIVQGNNISIVSIAVDVSGLSYKRVYYESVSVGTVSFEWTGPRTIVAGSGVAGTGFFKILGDYKAVLYVRTNPPALKSFTWFFHTYGAANADGDYVEVSRFMVERTSNTTIAIPSEYVSNNATNTKYNEIVNSEDILGARWLTAGSTRSSNVAIAPNGYLLADKIVETATTGQHTVYQDIVKPLANTTFTSSTHVKAAERSWAYLQLDDAFSAGVRVFFDLANGVVGATQNISGSPFFGTTSQISAAGNGWYRIAVTTTATSSTAAYRTQVGVANANSSHTFAGDTANGILVWGTQVERGNTLTDYKFVGNNYPFHGAGVDGVKYFSNHPGNQLSIEGYHPTLIGQLNNFFTTADTAQNSITGDLDIVAHVHRDWSNSSIHTLVSKYTTVDGRSYLLQAFGRSLRFYSSLDGLTTSAMDSTTTVPFANNTTDGWVRVTRVASNGRVQFFTANSTTSNVQNLVWVKLGNDRTSNAGMLYDTNTPLQIGAFNATGSGDPLVGRVHRAMIYNNGTLVAEFNPSRDAINNTTIVSASTGETWTGRGASALTPMVNVVERGGQPISQTKNQILYLRGDSAGNANAFIYANTPNVTSGLDVRFQFAPHDVTPGTTPCIIGRWTDVIASGKSWLIRLNTNGTLRLNWAKNNTNRDVSAVVPLTATTAVGAGDGGKIWGRVQLVDTANSPDPVGHHVAFYASTDYDPDTRTGTWIPCGNVSSTATDGTVDPVVSNVTIGVYNFSASTAQAATYGGHIYRAQIFSYNTLVTDFDPNDYVSGNTITSSRTGETWNMTGYARVVNFPLLGYQSEGERSNFVRQSNDPANTAAYVHVNVAITSNATSGPDGNTGSAHIITANGTSVHEARTIALSTGSGQYDVTFSLFAKAKESTQFLIDMSDNFSGDIVARVNIANGYTSAVSYSGKWANGEVRVIPYANGWYRVALTGTKPNGSTQVLARCMMLSNTFSSNFTATGNESFYIYGWQVEHGRHPTSYIATGADVVVSPADVLVYPVPARMANTRGKVYVETSSMWERADNVTRAIIDLGNNRTFGVDKATGNVALNDNGTNARLGYAYLGANNAVRRLSASWSNTNPGNTTYTSVDGVVHGDAFTSSMGIGPMITIGGQNQSGTNAFSGTIRNVKLWGTDYVDAQHHYFYASLMGSIMPENSFGTVAGTTGIDSGMPVLFTRATEALVEDWEGRLQKARPGEARFHGLRRVHNLLADTEFKTAIALNSGVAWQTSNAGTGVPPTVTANYTGNTAPDGTFTALRLQCSLGTGGNTNASNISYMTSVTGIAQPHHYYARSIWMKTNDGTTCNIVMRGVGLTHNADCVTVTPNWQRLSAPPSTITSLSGNFFTIGLRGNTSPTYMPVPESCDILLWHPQMEDVTTSMIATPSEYVSNGVASWPYFGANVDGVQYFTTPHTNVWNPMTRVVSTANSNTAFGRVSYAVLPGGRIPGTTGGNYISTPNTAANYWPSSNDVIDVDWSGALDHWAYINPNFTQQFIMKYGFGPTQRSWLFGWSSGGALLFTWADNTQTTRSASVVPPILGGTTNFPYVGMGMRFRVAANVAAPTANVTFYGTSDLFSDEPVWANLGSVAVATSGGIYAGTPGSAWEMNIGVTNGGDSGIVHGKVLRAKIYRGIRDQGGTLIHDFDASRAVAGQNTVVAITGETWTLNSNAIVDVYSSNAYFKEAFVTDPVANVRYAQVMGGYFNEGKSNNLVRWSENLSNSVVWIPSSANLTIAWSSIYFTPDNSLNANTLIAASGDAYIYQDLGALQTTHYTVSAYIRKSSNNLNYICLAANTFGGTSSFSNGIIFNTDTGVISNTFGTIQLTNVYEHHKWWRVSFGVAHRAGNLIIGFYPAYNRDGTITANAAISGTANVWGIQVENSFDGSAVAMYHPTSYMWSGSANTPRAADSLTYPGQDKNMANTGAVHAEFGPLVPNYGGTAPYRIVAHTVTTATPIGGVNSSGYGRLGHTAWDGGAIMQSSSSTIRRPHQVRSLQSTFDANTDSAFVYLDGGYRGGYSNARPYTGHMTSTFGAMGIGNGASGVPHYGYVRNVRWFKNRTLNDVQIAKLAYPNEPRANGLTLHFDFTQNTLTSIVGNVTPTFIRTGNTSTYVNSTGYISYAAANVARFHYNPMTGVCYGLLIEDSKTNLIMRSSDVANSVVWTRSNNTVTTNNMMAPDGSMEADTITWDSTVNGAVGAITYATFPANNVVTGSMWIKPDQLASWFRIQVAHSADAFRMWFNPTANTIGACDAVGNSSFLSSSIEPYPNGWYRITISGTCNTVSTTTATTAVLYMIPAALNGSGNRVPNAVFHLWGSQLEAGALSSYIPTTDSTLTRGMDICFVSGLQNTPQPTWYNTQNCTVFADFTPTANHMLTVGQIFSLDCANAVHRWGMRRSTNTNIDFVNVVNSASQGTGQWNGVISYSNNYSNSATIRVGMAASNGWHFSIANSMANVSLNENGISPMSANQVTTLHIGCDPNKVAPLMGCIGGLRYYNYRIPDAIMQNMYDLDL
jgi:hypothetical protein